MNQRLKFKTWNHSYRRKHRQYTLWYQKLSSIFWMSPQARGKKSKNKQMGPSTVVQLCLTLCDPIDCSTPGFAVHHQLPETAQTYVHPVGDAIQSSHPLSSPSPPAFNLSQHQGLFQWVSSLHQVAKVLELQHQSFQWICRTHLL